MKLTLNPHPLKHQMPKDAAPKIALPAILSATRPKRHTSCMGFTLNPNPLKHQIPKGAAPKILPAASLSATRRGDKGKGDRSINAKSYTLQRGFWGAGHCPAPIERCPYKSEQDR